MYIIVVGGGKVGYHLTKALLTDGHEILVIERDKRKCDIITDELGGVVMHGDGCEAAILADAGTARADMVIAVTGDDEDNMVVCQVAKAKFKVPRTIARINNPKNEGIFKHLGIDETVSSTQVIMERIQMGMPSHPLLHLMDMKAHGLEMVEFRIPAGAKAVGRRMRELSLPPQSVIPLIISPTRGPIVPTGETVIEAEAEMIALTRVETEDQVRLLFTEAR
jgi:trk system potassium uptake protein TrkA